MSNNYKQRVSLASRVTLFVGVVISICLLALGWVVLNSIEAHFAEQDADELRVVAAAVIDVLEQRVPEQYRSDQKKLSSALESAVSGHHGVYFLVKDDAGNQLYSSADSDWPPVIDRIPPVDRIRRNNLTHWRHNNDEYRGAVIHTTIATKAGPRVFTVAVAASLNFHLTFLSSFEKTWWTIIVAAGLLTLLAAWFAVHRGLSPLRKISEEIRHIGSNQLQTRLDLQTVPKEIMEVVTAFNEMLDRIEDVVQRLSNFSADIAHELRTPITNLMTQTEVALSQARGIEKYREILYSSLEEYGRIAKMINDMLWLAKSDNGMIEPDFRPLHLEQEIKAVFDYFGALAEDHELSLKLEGHCPKIFGERPMLRQALNNLLTNAIRHARKNSVITVRLERENDRAIITVENMGENIPAEQLSKLFHRFYRLDPARQRDSSGEGTGLGLAIVESIVKIHGGTISVSSTNGITAFRISLPILSTENTATLNQNFR